jgi:DNA-nicking Smr family endonuclease
MSRKHSLSEEESVLFRDAVKDSRPLPKQQRTLPRPPKLPDRPRQSEADERDVMDRLLDHDVDPAALEAGDALSYRGAGVQDSVMRRLKRGDYSCEAECDLHGMTVAHAREAVPRFLKECRQRGYRCVRIIHGKGLRSPQTGPVLKLKVAGWLQQRQDVLAYASARPADGGTGALYVLLRR